MKSPIFLFSLPRSGSTLLQRILMGHSDIASVAEPWFLLPFVYSNKEHGVISEYSHSVCYQGIEDVINNLPDKQNDYNRFLSKFANNIYSSLCENNETYFLEKTPRYYFILPEIAQIFPEAKFIFLFRNPVHIYSSILKTWGNDRFNLLYNNHADLYEGPRLLSKGYELLKNKSYAIQYESFINNPEKHLRELLQYLKLEYDESLLNNFIHQNTKGRLGDPTGAKIYNRIEKTSLNKWENTFSNIFRKKIIIKYISNLDEHSLNLQGYSKKQIINDINRLRPSRRGVFRDIADYIFSVLVIRMKANLFFGIEAKKWIQKKFLS